jgi:deoxyribodipyrimidine photo-lyase
LDSSIPVYIIDPKENLGEGSKRWLRKILRRMPWMNVYSGSSKETILHLVKTNAVTKVVWDECYEPWRRRLDSEIVAELDKMSVDCEIFQSNLLWRPKGILKPDRTPYKVFTQFYKRCLTNPIREIAGESRLRWIQLTDCLKQEELDSILGNDEINPLWQNTAEEKLDIFLSNGLFNYKVDRNVPGKENVSRLSPYLHFGEISPVQVWHAATNSRAPKADIEHFLSELGWREFSYYLLYWFPELPQKNFQPKFDNFPWSDDMEKLSAWKEGQTGYPIVDAGIRQLLKEGYIHNRVRMVVASFLVKNLFIHWHHGRDWFWKHLHDADLANNSASWQWVAGSGADAAPYYRIFNPVLQAEKFDPEGIYIRKYVPELADFPVKYLPAPWTAPPEIRSRFKYPDPIVDCDLTRKISLAAYKALQSKL